MAHCFNLLSPPENKTDHFNKAMHMDDDEQTQVWCHNTINNYGRTSICLWFIAQCVYTQRRVSQTNVILQYKLLASILSAVCGVIQQSLYVLHFYYTLYDGKYDCKITTH